MPKMLFMNWRESDSQAVEIDHSRTGYGQSRREQAPLHEELTAREQALRDNRIWSIQKLKEWWEIGNFDSKNFREEEWSKIIGKMSNLYAVDNYFTFRVNLRYFFFIVNPEDCWVAVRSRQIFGTHRVCRQTFLQIHRAFSSTPYLGGFNPWLSSVTEDTSPYVTSERQNPDTTLTPRCQTGPLVGNSFDRKEWRFSKDCGTGQRRLQISELHFDKFPTPTTFPLLKIRFKTEVYICSKFPTEAMQWIKGVEKDDSVDD